jgi:transcriptional regulator with XRE-family HTH domain
MAVKVGGIVEEPLFPPSQASARAIGARLRNRRKQMHLSLRAVEVMSEQEFKASALAAYERGELGERAISMPRLQRLAELYDTPVSLLLPSHPYEG